MIRHRFAPVRERKLRIQLAGLSKELLGLFVLEQMERRDPFGEHGFGLRLGGRSRVEQRQSRTEHHPRETNMSFSLGPRAAPPEMATLELHPLVTAAIASLPGGRSWHIGSCVCWRVCGS